MVLFQRKDAAEKTGLEPSSVQLYTDRGLVLPAHNPNQQGKTRLYDAKNLVELMACKKIIQTGLTLNNVAFIMNQIRDNGDDRLFNPITPIKEGCELIVIISFASQEVCWKNPANENENNIEARLITAGRGVICVCMEKYKHSRIINITKEFQHILSGL